VAGQRIGYVRVSTLDQNEKRQLEGQVLDRLPYRRSRYAVAGTAPALRKAGYRRLGSGCGSSYENSRSSAGGLNRTVFLGLSEIPTHDHLRLDGRWHEHEFAWELLGSEVLLCLMDFT